jgi:hypothetical protein
MIKMLLAILVLVSCLALAPPAPAVHVHVDEPRNSPRNSKVFVIDTSATWADHPGSTSGWLVGPWAGICERETGGDNSLTGPVGERGIVQFLQSTWDETVRNAGNAHLVGRDPASITVVRQIRMAEYLRTWSGIGHWTTAYNYGNPESICRITNARWPR